MAKIRIWTSKDCKRKFVTNCTGNVTINNDGVVNIHLPNELGMRLMKDGKK